MQKNIFVRNLVPNYYLCLARKQIWILVRDKV